MDTLFSNKKQANFLCAFVLLEAALYWALHCTDFYTSAVKYLCVSLAFAFSLLPFNTSPVKPFTIMALFCTAMADVFFVLCNPPQIVAAMTFFLVVAMCYFARLIYPLNVKWRVAAIVFRTLITLAAVAAWLFAIKKSADATSTLSVIYFVNLLLNTLHASANLRRSPCFAIGLLLFLCCDVLIGINAADRYLKLNSTYILQFARKNANCHWLFYVPSQALLAISANEKQ